MTDNTKYNTQFESNNNQEALEDIIQKMDYISNNPQVKGTPTQSHCRTIKKHCKSLVTYLSNFFSDNSNVKDTDKANSNHINSKIQGMRKDVHKLADKVPSEKPLDPSLLQELQEGLQELAKDVQKLYKFVVNNLKKLAVKIGIRKETVLEKGQGFINNVSKKVADKVAKAEVDVTERIRNIFSSGAKKSASSKNNNTRSKSNDYRSRNKNSSRNNNSPSSFS